MHIMFFILFLRVIFHTQTSPGSKGRRGLEESGERAYTFFYIPLNISQENILIDLEVIYFSLSF